jgi:hypothetical protein
MAPYVLAFSLPLLLFPLRKLNRYAYVFVLALAWSLFAGLRLGIGGNDYFAYEGFYGALRGLVFGSADPRFEPLFRWLGLASKALGIGFHGFLSLSALLAILPAVYVIDRHSDGEPVALIVFGIEWMLYGSFVIIRQSIAMGLAFLAYDALKEKRLIWFTAFVAIAAGFHYSALLLFVLPLFMKTLDYRLRTAFFASACALLCALELFLNIGALEGSQISLLNKLLHYLGPGGANRLNLLNVAEILALSVLAHRYLREELPLFRNAYFLYICFAILALQDAIFIRFGWYFEIAIVLLIPTMLREAWKHRYEGQIVSLGLFLYYAAKIARWLLTNADGLGGFLPYRWILG